MYRTVIKNDPLKDANKTEAQIAEELYTHTEHKNDINRNMLATLYVKDPYKFSD